MLEITPTITKQNDVEKKLGDFEWLTLLPDELRTAHIFEVYKALIG